MIVRCERPPDSGRGDSRVRIDCDSVPRTSGTLTAMGRYEDCYSWTGFPSTVMPIDRAVPATMLAPFSTV